MTESDAHGSNRAHAWDIDDQELARLRSEDPIIQRAAWGDLWSRLLPRVEAKIRSKFHDKPRFLQQRIDDIAHDVTIAAVEKVHEPFRKTFGHYLYRIVEKQCMRALRPDKHSRLRHEKGFVTNLDEAAWGAAGRDEGTPSRFAALPERAQKVRKAVTHGLQDVLIELADRSSRPRSSDATAPVLQMLAIDLCCTGRDRPADLIEATGIANHTATRLRAAVAELLHEAIEPQLRSVESALDDPKPSLDLLDPDGLPAAVWTSHHNMGCPPLWFDDVHPDHLDDVRRYKESHCDRGDCPYCGADPEGEFDPARLEHWLDATHDSMLHSRSRG